MPKLLDTLIKLKLIPWDDSKLKKSVPEFEIESMSEQERAEVIVALRNFQKANGGMGLSAIQLGLPIRLFILGLEKGAEHDCWNPELLGSSDTKISWDEGCLSYPNFYVKIHRPEWVQVAFTNTLGKKEEHTFYGMTARVWQHEFDHQNGILFTDRASPVYMKQAFARKKKYERTLRKRAKEKENTSKLSKPEGSDVVRSSKKKKVKLWEKWGWENETKIGKRKNK